MAPTKDDQGITTTNIYSSITTEAATKDDRHKKNITTKKVSRTLKGIYRFRFRFVLAIETPGAGPVNSSTSICVCERKKKFGGRKKNSAKIWGGVKKGVGVFLWEGYLKLAWPALDF